MQAKPVRKTIGGVTFEDRFAHLHDDTPEALDWQWARDELARQAVEASPNHRPVRDRLRQLSDAGGVMVPRKRGALWFGFGRDGDDQAVCASETPGGEGRAIVSTRQIAATHDGGTVTMYRLVASPRGRYIAVAWSADGDMIGKWSVYETATGRHVVTDARGIMYSGALPGWLPDETGYWLDGRTDDGLHCLHFTSVDADALARPDIVLPATLVEPRHSGLILEVAPDGRRGVAVTMPHERIALVHIDLETLKATPFVPIGFEGECDGSWLDSETFVARVNVGEARGEVVAIPASSSIDRKTWRVLVPEGEGFINWAGVVAGRIYVGDMIDVSLRVRVFDLDGRLSETLPLDNPGSSPSMAFDRAVRSTDAFILSHATFKRSAVTFVHDPDTGRLHRIDEARYRLDDAHVEQRFATSRDGARIPYFLIHCGDAGRSRRWCTAMAASTTSSCRPSSPMRFPSSRPAASMCIRPCAAAANMGAPGTMRAACSTSATRSTISRPSPRP